MREIKFRCWQITDYDYDEKPIWGMINAEDLAFEEFKPLVDLLKSDPDSEIFMQFTGLKDKNGKDVYEGDLLREPAKNEWEKTNFSCFEVFFHDGDAHSEYNIGFTMARMHNHGAICGGVVPSFKPKQVSKMEVIGNIHESPELIKGGGK